MSDTNVVDGWNCNRVEYGDGQERKGTLQQVARDLWSEDSVIAGEVHFEYTELRRDQWSVYLRDAGRDMYLQLDLHTRELKYGVGAAPTLPMYVIVEASQRPHGRMVNRVDMGQGGAPNGSLRQVGSSRWQEVDVKGAVTFNYDEVGRDDWSVNLHDAARDVRLRVDLHTRTIYYAHAGNAESPLYEVLGAADQVNGWLVNLVEVGSADDGPTGRFSQQTTTQWAEMDLDGAERRRLNEVARDDWSAYLHDPRRDERVQLDLHTHRVNITAGGEPSRHVSDVLTATDINVPPPPLPDQRVVRGFTVNRVEMVREGEPVGALRQVDNVTWIEDSVSDGRDRHRFDERMRDEWSVYLHDPERNLSLQIDLHTKLVSFGHGTTVSQVLADVSSASDEPTGWLATEVVAEAGGTGVTYRQVDWTTWVEIDDVGTERSEYVERRRDDWSVYLGSGDGKERQLDLFTRQVKRCGPDAQVIGTIVGAAAAEGAWALGERITSRSQLATLYGPGSSGKEADVVTAGTAYRASITFSPATRWVEVRATDETEVTIRGEHHRIDAVKAVRVQPNDAAKIVVTVPAVGLRCASLSLSTNLMKPGTRHLVMPDAHCHKKVAGLEKGALKRNRAALGVDRSVDGKALDQAQRTVQDLLAGVQYTYNVTPTGIQHDRAVRPANMHQPNFSLDLAGDTLGRANISEQAAARKVAAAVQVTGAAQTSPFESFLAGGVDVLTVTVTTGLAVGGEILEGGVELLDQGGKTIDAVGERLINGDPEGAGRELLQGGENMGRTLNDRGQNILEHGKNGAEEIAVIVIETLEGKSRSLEASVNAFLEVAQDVIERIGVAWDRFVDWLADVIGWGGVLDTQRAIQDLVTSSLADASAMIPELRSGLAGMMDDVRAMLGGPSEPVTRQPSQRPSDPVGAAMAELDALFDEILSGLPGNELLDALPVTPRIGDVGGRLSSLVADGGADLLATLGRTAPAIAESLTQAGSEPDRLMEMVIEAFRDVALLGIDLVESASEVLLDVLGEVLDLCAALLALELPIPGVSEFYGALTGGETMTLGGLVALVLAIPVTITHRAMLGSDPNFGQAAALVNQDPKGLGITYGIAHFAMTITDAISLVSRHNKVCSAFGATFALVAQACQCPQSPARPAAVRKGDVLRRPDYFAEAIWGYQWMFTAVDVIGVTRDGITWHQARSGIELTEIGGPDIELTEIEPRAAGSPRPRTPQGGVQQFATGALGLGHLALMLCLHDADDRKVRFLDDAFAGLGPRHTAQDVETAVVGARDRWREAENFPKDQDVDVPDGDPELAWTNTLLNYHEWGTTGGMLALKTTGNVLDSVPPILQLFTLLNNPTARAIAVGVGAAAHLGEGVIYLVRTGGNQLL